MRNALRALILGSLCMLGGACTQYDSATAARQMSAAGITGVRLHGPASVYLATVDSRVAKQNRGIFALTDREIIMLARETYQPISRLNYTDLSGVALRRFGRSRQLQVVRGTTLVAFVPTMAGDQLIDVNTAEKAFTFIRGRGVQEIKSPGNVGEPQPITIYIP